MDKGGSELGELSFILGPILLIIPIPILLVQFIYWLKDGIWPKTTISSVCEFINESPCLNDWLIDPQSWLGLHKIISHIMFEAPITLVLFISGMGVMWIASND